GKLPEGAGCLWIKKRPHLFLLADLGRRPAPAPSPASVEGSPGGPGESDFGNLFDAVYERLAREHPAARLVSLVRLRQGLPLARDAFDNELSRLRRAGRYTLTGAEGGHGLSPEERAAGIEEHGDLLLFVSRRDGA